MGCQARQLCDYLTRDTIDCRILWDNTQSDYKNHELNAVTWNNLYLKVFLLSEREISQIIKAFSYILSTDLVHM